MNPYFSAYTKNSIDRQSRIRRDRFSIAALLVFFTLTICFFLVYKRTLGQHLMYEVQQLRSIHKQLLTENSVLLAEKQHYLSRERITGYAREKLGLDFPAPESIRWIRVETAPGQRSSAAAMRLE
jgi:cell division protein FtsL